MLYFELRHCEDGRLYDNLGVCIGVGSNLDVCIGVGSNLTCTFVLEWEWEVELELEPISYNGHDASHDITLIPCDGPSDITCEIPDPKKTVTLDMDVPLSKVKRGKLTLILS